MNMKIMANILARMPMYLSILGFPEKTEITIHKVPEEDLFPGEFWEFQIGDGDQMLLFDGDGDLIAAWAENCSFQEMEKLHSVKATIDSCGFMTVSGEDQ